MILLIDNYDSFTYNLYQYIGELYSDIKVVRNDEITITEIKALNPNAIIISPGPGYPKEAGISVDVIKEFSGEIPILGVCLGHQAIIEAFGGTIVKADELMHGKSSSVKIDGSSKLFKGLPETISAARYHSLIGKDDTVPECIKITARDSCGQIMAVEHKEYPVYGLQFHPESILTDTGKAILVNFLEKICSLDVKSDMIISKDEPPKTELKPFVSKAADGLDLTEKEAEEAMDCIMSGRATNAQIAAFLTALRSKGETTEEITGFVKGMRKKAAHVKNNSSAIDIVGTGGDLSNTFNISTTSAFVIAAAGARVAKHGNRSVSSRSGAADVLECLGAKITSTPQKAEELLNDVGISFLFAQNYHGSMKFVAPVRRELGIRTVFNILGPLSNPAFTDYILLGVYDKSLLESMARVLINVGIKRAMLVYGNDKLDEISISDTTSVCEIKDGKYEMYVLNPEEYGFKLADKSEVVGGTPEENAQITTGILKGEIQGAKRNIVIINSACALYICGKAKSISEGISLAKDTMDSGRAYQKLNEFVKATNSEV